MTDSFAKYGISMEDNMRVFDAAPSFAFFYLLYDASSVVFQRGSKSFCCFWALAPFLHLKKNILYL